MKRLLSFIWKVLSMPTFDAFKEGAEQGDAPAQYSLALLYYDGQGVAQDYTEAVKWFRKAADQGYVEAMHNLGLMYAKGQGVPQDYVEAHKWSDLAASRHRPGKKRDDSVHDRNFLAKRMTPAQIAEAQRLAREWAEAPTTREEKKAPLERKITVSELKEALENRIEKAWKHDLENIRKEMQVDDTRYGKSKKLDEIYDERNAYNNTLDIVIDISKLNLMNKKKRDILRKLIIEVGEKNITEEKKAKIVSYLFIARDLKERLLSGMFHKSPGVLNETGDKLMDLRFDMMDHLEKLGKCDADDLEDDYVNILEGIKGINIEPENAFDTTPENRPLIEQIKDMFNRAKGSEKMEFVAWAAIQMGVDLKDSSEDEEDEP